MLISVASQDIPEVDSLCFMLDKNTLEEFAIFSDFSIRTNQDYLDQRKSTRNWHLEQGLVNDLKTILRLGHAPIEWPSIPGAFLILDVADTTETYRYHLGMYQLGVECHEGGESINITWCIEEYYGTDDDRSVCYLDSMDGNEEITGLKIPYGQWNHAAIHVFDLADDKNPDFDFVREMLNWCRR